jgi:hypothetical protein
LCNQGNEVTPGNGDNSVEPKAELGFFASSVCPGPKGCGEAANTYPALNKRASYKPAVPTATRALNKRASYKPAVPTATRALNKRASYK